MRLIWWQSASMLGWTSLALTMVFGLVFVATGVEQVAGGWAAALGGALSIAPDLVVRLSPLCCALGAAMTLARRMGSGEDVGLAACGVRPWKSGRGVIFVGLVIGLMGSLASDQILPSLAQSDADPEWVWLDRGPARASDGYTVLMADGKIVGAEAGVPVPAERLQRAAWSRAPRTAPDAALLDNASPPSLSEYWSRRTRVVLCGLLAWLGWVPVGRRAVTQIGWALGVGTATTGLDIFMRQLAAQGQIPVGVGVLVALVMLLCVVFRLRELS